MATAMERMSQAKSLLLMDQVFFATLIMGSKIIETMTMPDGTPNPTAYTDMLAIYYNPVFILGLPGVDMVKFVLAHEVMHIALMHGIRRGSRNAYWKIKKLDPKTNAWVEEKIDVWGVACDFAINWMLKKAKFTIWPNCYCSDEFDGMSAEQIYDILVQKSGGGAGGSEAGDGSGGYYKEDSFLKSDLVDAQHKMDPIEKAKFEQHVRRMVADATTQARMQGQLPAFLERFVNGVLSPPLPWERHLEDFAHRIVDRDLNWGKRNRRFASIYLPSRRSEAMGELIIIGDTSGSIPDALFAQTGVEMKYIIEIVKPERIRVIWADDEECGAMEVFEPEDEIILNPIGGGGTDMRKPMKYAEQFDPVCVILITDCLTPWPEKPPPYNLITLSSLARKSCPHGTTIYFNGPVDG